MRTLTVELGPRSYPIHIGAGLLDNRELLMAAAPWPRILIVTDSNVGPLYLQRLLDGLRDRDVSSLTLPAGEEHKNMATLQRIVDTLVAGGYNRDSGVVALGGGVVGDVAGFAAACYQRGVPFVQIPTSLLAQVDSSVGGKTAVNHPGGKNLVGAFHQPHSVIADIDTLGTLPAREWRAGLAEVVKYGLITDAVFFDWLETNSSALHEADPDTVSEAVARCCTLKAAIVARDEFEHGCRALLNFGHTFGHAIENTQGYGSWLHGEAVAAGMVLAARLSASRGSGWLPGPDLDRIIAWLAAAGLPVSPPAIPVETMMTAMKLDKKVSAGRVRLVLLRAIGDAVLCDDYPPALLCDVLEAHCAAPA